MEIHMLQLFERLKMENPSTLTKVSVISYNPLETGLGLKQIDLEKIKSSVNIIINAGIVRQPTTAFKDAVYVNINVTRALLILAKQMPHLEVICRQSDILQVLFSLQHVFNIMRLCLSLV